MRAEVAPEAQVDHVHAGLIDRLVMTTALSRPEAARIVGDVLDHFGESTEEVVRRRHRELQAERVANAAAFEIIASELPLQRVEPPRLSLRQLRRIVYG